LFFGYFLVILFWLHPHTAHDNLNIFMFLFISRRSLSSFWKFDDLALAARTQLTFDREGSRLYKCSMGRGFIREGLELERVVFSFRRIRESDGMAIQIQILCGCTAVIRLLQLGASGSMGSWFCDWLFTGLVSPSAVWQPITVGDSSMDGASTSCQCHTD